MRLLALALVVLISALQWPLWMGKGSWKRVWELDSSEAIKRAAREVQRATVEAAPLASCWLAHDTDYIESWAPFSNVPTHYLISVDGIQKWYGQ